ncbi:molybdopterin-dependent oxidoreductase [Devosia sp.]|uniref:molybdopterin-dependent oxidoreductase n=1 Tax=Devosia sp. TaxID=1871048 RepID=UPI001ACC9D92|nr:molybdopterin-dependent oxidoreductase [Devosia sp.]MBN9334850.1 molybdopterin-dependent oxidoreductase [Devosia sp.]
MAISKQQRTRGRQGDGPMKRRHFLKAAAAATGTALSTSAFGASEPVVLEVSGQVETTRTFTLSDLKALGIAKLTTSTPWTDGTPEFEGVWARDVIDAIGRISSNHVTAIALNDYRADIPLSDFRDYDVLFAWSMNGQMLTRRDKGPLWIIYPRDAVPMLREERFEHRWVWQLYRLILP